MKLKFDVKRLDLRVLLLLFAAALISTIWGLTLYQLSVAKKVHIESAERDARSLARLFEEHATRTFEAADQAVIYLRHRYNTVGTSLDIAADMKIGLDPDNIYNLFTICDEYGNVVLSSLPFTPMNLQDREHIQVHMQNDSGKMFISKPVMGRVSKKWSIQMTRRINYPDGRFKGVVVASMDPQYFTRLYHEIDVGANGTISLIGADGVIRVRRIGDSDSRGQDISNTPLFKAMLANGSGTTRALSSLDGRSRIVAYAKVKGYPVYAVVGIDLEERFETYYEARLQTLILASLFSCLVLAFTAGLIMLVGRLMQSREQAISANLAKSRFLANMSHELRTPLNGILGYSEILCEEAQLPEHRVYARTVNDCGNRLLTLINAVLELSAMESGTIKLVVQPENLASLLAQATDRHRGPATAKQVALSIMIASDTPAMLACDRDKLIRVLDGLLDNAVRFTVSGTIVLSASTVAGNTVFSVKDSGPGVSPELQAQIFENFSQTDDSPSRAIGGIGLGLAITSRIVRQMGGVLLLTSVAGQGATFSFTLPRDAP